LRKLAAPTPVPSTAEIAENSDFNSEFLLARRPERPEGEGFSYLARKGPNSRRNCSANFFNLLSEFFRGLSEFYSAERRIGFPNDHETWIDEVQEAI
jgi:hypothetical protein